MTNCLGSYTSLEEQEMRIDELFTDNADGLYGSEASQKQQFYLGLVSTVRRDAAFVQVENLSLLNYRKTKTDELVPNTINFYVIVDSQAGLFIGEVFQSKVGSNDNVHATFSNRELEKVYPEIGFEVLGVLTEGIKFKFAGFKTVGIGDKVYIANKQTLSIFLNSLEINEYGQNVMENMAVLRNFDVSVGFQPNTLFDRHLMTIGTTNSGKSTSALSILDKMVTSGRKILLIDPTGEYRDAFESDLVGNPGEIKKLTLGDNAIMSIGQLSMKQWSLLFQTNDGSQDTELMKAIKSLRFQNLRQTANPDGDFDKVYRKVGQSVVSVQKDMDDLYAANHDGEFDLKFLPQQIIEEAVKEGERGSKGIYVEDGFRSGVNTWLAEKVQTVLENSSIVNFFGTDENKSDLLTEIDKFVKSKDGNLYIDASGIGVNDGVGQMVIDLVSGYLANVSRDKVKPFVIFIDEVHRYMNTHENFPQNGLTSLIREGRKKGIFLFLTTQSPKDVPDVILGQIGTLIIHRITHAEELKAIQNLVRPNTLGQITQLGQGEAIISSINLLEDVSVRFMPANNRKHDNVTPLL